MPPTPSADPLKVWLDLAVARDPLGASPAQRALARELLVELDPQDAAERMLAAQMIATFTRSMFLSRCANYQKQPMWFDRYSAESDRAMNLFRRQMQALDEHRRPRRTTFNAIRTANIANQQVLVTTAPPRDQPLPADQQLPDTQLPDPDRDAHP